jgi:hypothetical protein
MKNITNPTESLRSQLNKVLSKLHITSRISKKKSEGAHHWISLAL